MGGLLIRYEFFIRFDLKLLQFQIIGLNKEFFSIETRSQSIYNNSCTALRFLKFSQNNLLKTRKYKIHVKLHYIFTRTLSPNFSFLRNEIRDLHHPPHLSKSRHRWRQHRDRH